MLGNLKAEMARRNIKMNDLIDCTGLSRGSVANKVAGKSEFSIYDAIAIRDKFFPGADLNSLFAKDKNPPA